MLKVERERGSRGRGSRRRGSRRRGSRGRGSRGSRSEPKHFKRRRKEEEETLTVTRGPAETTAGACPQCKEKEREAINQHKQVLKLLENKGKEWCGFRRRDLVLAIFQSASADLILWVGMTV